MGLKMKLNIVNKHEYEENEDYRELVIRIPKETEKLERDFKYLGLDYNNLSIQGTHVLKCEVIDTENYSFSKEMTREILNIIDKATNLGYTTPYQDIKQIFAIINTLNEEDREKLLAVLEMKSEEISNIKDAEKYASHLDSFTLYSDVKLPENYGRRIIEDGEVFVDDIMDYIDLSKLGEDYCNENGGRQTDYGLIMQTEIFDLDKQLTKQNEDEEEFE